MQLPVYHLYKGQISNPLAVIANQRHAVRGVTTVYQSPLGLLVLCLPSPHTYFVDFLTGWVCSTHLWSLRHDAFSGLLCLSVDVWLSVQEGVLKSLTLNCTEQQGLQLHWVLYMVCLRFNHLAGICLTKPWKAPLEANNPFAVEPWEEQAKHFKHWGNRWQAV